MRSDKSGVMPIVVPPNAATGKPKEQASQIQKVSAQLELKRPAPQMTVSNQ
jgi:hypothetical protein